MYKVTDLCVSEILKKQTNKETMRWDNSSHYTSQNFGHTTSVALYVWITRRLGVKKHLWLWVLFLCFHSAPEKPTTQSNWHGYVFAESVGAESVLLPAHSYLSKWFHLGLCFKGSLLLCHHEVALCSVPNLVWMCYLFPLFPLFFFFQISGCG